MKMPGVLFLQSDWLERLGTLYLSAFLKTKNIPSNIIITRSPKKLSEEIERLKPALLAVSIASAGHQAMLEFLREAKPQIKIPVVAGGPHPTFFPEALADPALDFIIRGEGEESLQQLFLAHKDGSGFDQVPALGYKKDGGLKFNAPSKLLEDIDQLPFPDRALYFQYGYFRRLRMQRVLTCRGCPFNCAYCFNAALKEFYKGCGKYVRQRSPENVIAELKSILPKSDTFNFADDSFGLNRGFADEFLARYQAEIKRPFIVNLRPEQVDAELAKKLGDAGCYCAQVGIESGNDRLREQLLGRKVSKEEIRAAVRLLHERGLKVLSYNMLGLPGETLENGFETVRLNSEMKIDFPRFSIFQPYPGTRMGEDAVANGLANKEELLKNLSGSYFHKSVLKMPGIRELENLQKLFAPAVKFPGLEPLLKKLAKLPPNPVFELIFLSSIAAQYRKATNRSFTETIEYGFRNLSLYFQ